MTFVSFLQENKKFVHSIFAILFGKDRLSYGTASKNAMEGDSIANPDLPLRASIFGMYSGFTLVELLVTLTVLGVLVGAAIPAFYSLIQSARVSNHANNFMAALVLTRSEAVKRGAATLCPSMNGVACSGGTAWEKGWIIFNDVNTNGAVNSNEGILHVGEGLAYDNTLRSGARIRVTFRSDGFSQGFNDSFRLCDSRGSVSAKTVVLSNQGRVRVKNGAASCP